MRIKNARIKHEKKAGSNRRSVCVSFILLGAYAIPKLFFFLPLVCFLSLAESLPSPSDRSERIPPRDGHTTRACPVFLHASAVVVVVGV